MNRRVAAVALAAACVILGAGFVVFQGAGRIDPKQAERRLAERVDRFWKLRTRSDWARIYREVMPPEFRSRQSVEEFVESRGIIQYLAWTVDDVKIDGDLARVTCTIEVTIDHPRARALLPDPYIRSVVHDDWMLVDGEWYRCDPARIAEAD